MLKALAVHLLGGVLAALGEYFTFTFFKHDVIVGFLIAGIVMAFYYILAGMFLKNVSFVKAVSLMQIIAFIFRDITLLGESVKDILLILHGGSNIWLDASYYIFKDGSWYSFFAFVTLFLMFPIFIYIGQSLARKEFPKMKDKVMIAKTVLLHLVFGIIFSGCRILYISVFRIPAAETILYISAGAAVMLFIAGGMWLKNISGVRTFFIMFNLTLEGSALLVSPVAKKVAYPVIGGGVVLNDLANHLLSEGSLLKFTHILYLLPPLLVILGSFIGRVMKKER